MAGDPATLRLGELVQQLEPNMDLVECFNRDTNTCQIINTCQLKHFLMDANSAFLKSLNQYTLADAINHKKLFKDE